MRTLSKFVSRKMINLVRPLRLRRLLLDADLWGRRQAYRDALRADDIVACNKRLDAKRCTLLGLRHLVEEGLLPKSSCRTPKALVEILQR